jgi:hypothetical protein
MGSAGSSLLGCYMYASSVIAFPAFRKGKITAALKFQQLRMKIITQILRCISSIE